MNCYNHPNTSAVIQCQDCGKGLCYECSKKWETNICDECNYQRCKREQKPFIKDIILIVISSYIIFPMSNLGTLSNKIIFTYMLASIVWGLFSSSGESKYIVFSSSWMIGAFIGKLISGLIFFPINLLLNFFKFTRALKIKKQIEQSKIKM